jgi:lipoyl(octanoyl) transferase
LQAAGVAFVETGRGGNITCHNPGQLVGYPILNLSRWQEDVHWYVRQLEEVLIRTLADFGVEAGRKARYTGVWVGNQKIAAMGVSVRHWITGHGFALNVSNDLELFRSIVPCGIDEFGVTSLQALGMTADPSLVKDPLIKKFREVFEAEIHEEVQP